MLDDKLNELIKSKVSQLHEGDFWHPDPEKDRRLGGPGANQRAREDRAAASKPKEDPRKLRPGESYMDFAKRHGYKPRNESHVPGKPAEKLGAVTAIPQKERDAARERLLAKTKAIRDKKKIQEKIDVGADAGATISDFVHSKSKTFKGDSKKQRIKRALGAYYAAKNEEFELDEAEGSYGRTPKATAAYGALANKRRAKPASEYSERGEKKSKVTSAERHATRSQRTAADHSGRKSTKPAWHSYQRSNMTQSDRDHLRGQSEYGHVGYDPDGDGGPSGPGGKPKGKKLERQQKTGVSEIGRAHV